MTVYIIFYIAILLIIGIFDGFRVKSFEDYAVAGKRQSQAMVVMSLMATMIGASATIGVMGRVSSIGFPAFWWLAVGSIGLFIQAGFVSEKVRALEADTLPDAVGKLAGGGGKMIVAVIIIIAWPGIVASQIIAMSSILALVTGKENNKTLMLIVALAVVAYTMIGGQLSVIKTDAIQFVIILIAFAATFFYLFFFADGEGGAVLSEVRLFNDNYGIKELMIQFFIVGGTYLLGPDVMSRNLVAKDEKTAKKSTIIAGVLLLIFAIIISLVGLYIITNERDLKGLNPLLYIIKYVLPKPIGVLLALGLLSTLLSSADTCLVNISSIIEFDVLKRNKVWEARLWAAVVGMAAVMIAFSNSDIISMLTGAYSVYAPGIVCPLFAAICCHGKREFDKRLWLAAVCAGGLCGAVSTYGSYIAPSLLQNRFVVNDLPITGMGISLLLAVFAVLKGQKQDYNKI